MAANFGRSIPAPRFTLLPAPSFYGAFRRRWRGGCAGAPRSPTAGAGASSSRHRRRTGEPRERPGGWCSFALPSFQYAACVAGRAPLERSNFHLEVPPRARLSGHGAFPRGRTSPRWTPPAPGQPGVGWTLVGPTGEPPASGADARLRKRASAAPAPVEAAATEHENQHDDEENQVGVAHGAHLSVGTIDKLAPRRRPGKRTFYPDARPQPR